MAILGNNKLGLNGLGGELYRNYDWTTCRRIDFVEWFKRYIMDPHSAASLDGRDTLQKLIDYVAVKYKRTLGVSHLDVVNKFMRRRCYESIWLPYAAGSRVRQKISWLFSLCLRRKFCQTGSVESKPPLSGMGGKFES